MWLLRVAAQVTAGRGTSQACHHGGAEIPESSAPSFFPARQSPACHEPPACAASQDVAPSPCARDAAGCISSSSAPPPSRATATSTRSDVHGSCAHTDRVHAVHRPPPCTTCAMTRRRSPASTSATGRRCADRATRARAPHGPDRATPDRQCIRWSRHHGRDHRTSPCVLVGLPSSLESESECQDAQELDNCNDLHLPAFLLIWGLMGIERPAMHAGLSPSWPGLDHDTKRKCPYRWHPRCRCAVLACCGDYASPPPTPRGVSLRAPLAEAGHCRGARHDGTMRHTCRC